MKITVCAGHSDKDPGAVGHGLTEAALMRDLRDIVADKLRSKGHTVRTDGGRLENWPLLKAITLIAGTDVAIELHVNAATDKMARGVEVFSLPTKRLKSQRIAQAIADVLGTKVRGAGGWKDQKESQHGTLGFVRGGGLLVEVFFLSNDFERNAYLDKYYLVAQAIADAVESA